MLLSLEVSKEYSLLEDVAQLAASADAYVKTDAHALRVAELSQAVALYLGLSAQEAGALGEAALFHDVGKLGLPKDILEKPGRLSPSEVDLMQRHTLLGAAILWIQGGNACSLAMEVALHHHERWDGAGYPRRLKGREIPLSGRIVAVTDAFDALINPRSYKLAWTVPSALEEVRRQTGSQFDPWVAEAFLQVVGKPYTPWLHERVMFEPRIEQFVAE